MSVDARGKRRQETRDRGRLVGVMGLAVFAVIIAGVTYAILDRSYDDHIAQVESGVIWKAEETAWDVAAFMEERRIDTAVTSVQKGLPKRIIDFKNGTDPESGTFVQDRLSVERLYHGCEAVAVFDSGGEVLMSAGTMPDDPSVLAAYVRSVAAAGDASFIEIVSPEAGWDVWWFSPMPAYAGETVIIGECVDVAPVMLDIIARHQESFSQGEIVILDMEDGEVVRSICTREGICVTDAELCTGIRALAVGSIGEDGLEILRVEECDGKEALGAVVAVTGTAWRVLTKVPESVVVEEVKDSHWTALGVDLMIFAVACMTVVLFQRGRERRAEQAASLVEIRKALETQDRFLANVSHELRTPLNSIMGFTSILLSGMAGALNAEQRKQLGMVDQSSKRLLALVNDVLDLSKLKSGKHPIIVSDFKVSEVVAQACELMGPVSAIKKLRCESGLPVQDVDMHTDREMVERVVLNLLSNAVKFTDEGFVSVDASYDPRHDRVHFVVRDSGRGISPEELSRVTEEFTQVVEPTGYKPVGTGLGLAISRRMAEALGGALMADSTPGEGSTFTFVVPRVYSGDGEADV